MKAEISMTDIRVSYGMLYVVRVCQRIDIRTINLDKPSTGSTRYIVLL